MLPRLPTGFQIACVCLAIIAQGFLASNVMLQVMQYCCGMKQMVTADARSEPMSKQHNLSCWWGGGQGGLGAGREGGEKLGSNRRLSESCTT